MIGYFQTGSLPVSSRLVRQILDLTPGERVVFNQDLQRLGIAPLSTSSFESHGTQRIFEALRAGHHLLWDPVLTAEISRHLQREIFPHGQLRLPSGPAIMPGNSLLPGGVPLEHLDLSNLPFGESDPAGTFSMVLLPHQRDVGYLARVPVVLGREECTLICRVANRFDLHEGLLTAGSFRFEILTGDLKLFEGGFSFSFCQHGDQRYYSVHSGIHKVLRKKEREERTPREDFLEGCLRGSGRILFEKIIQYIGSRAEVLGSRIIDIVDRSPSMGQPSNRILSREQWYHVFGPLLLKYGYSEDPKNRMCGRWIRQIVP